MRRMLEAVGRRDYQAVLAVLDPEVEIDDTDIPESTGTDTFLEWLARWDEAWESWRVEDVEVRPAGDDQAIALFRMVTMGKGSGIELALMPWLRLFVAAKPESWGTTTTKHWPSKPWGCAPRTVALLRRRIPDGTETPALESGDQPP